MGFSHSLAYWIRQAVANLCAEFCLCLEKLGHRHVPLMLWSLQPGLLGTAGSILHAFFICGSCWMPCGVYLGKWVAFPYLRFRALGEGAWDGLEVAQVPRPPCSRALCPSKHLVGLRVWGGCRSQGCHGYLRALLVLVSCLAPPSLRHLLQAHLLAMSLNAAKCNLG